MKTVRGWKRVRFYKHTNGQPLCRGEFPQRAEKCRLGRWGGGLVVVVVVGGAQNLWIKRRTRSRNTYRKQVYHKMGK
jgi:hypothetical protein